jgi:hypothetical protein
MAYCVLVQGPCRGKMCDFWARVKLRKRDTKEIAQDMYLSIRQCDNPGHTRLDDAIVEYWAAFGVKDMVRLCEEEPELCSKITSIEQRAKSLLS